VYLSTLGPLGYFPASGTIATMAMLPIVYFFSFLATAVVAQIVIICAVVITGLKIIGTSLESFKRRDPFEIVLDEVVGFLIVFCGIPFSFTSFVLGFILFRFFVIVKPFGLKKCELLYGSLGIVADDVLAGLFSNSVIRIVLYYWQ